MSRFKLPASRPPSPDADAWVADAAPPETKPLKPAKTEKPARLTIDLPPELHARFKATCALKKTQMVEEVRQFIEEWTQKHG